MNVSTSTTELDPWSRVDAALTASEAAVVDLTRELVQAPSPNPPGDERAVAEVLMRHVGDLHLATVATDPRRPNLVFDTGERSGPALLLSAHTDTAPANDGWSRGPFGGRVEGDRLYGRGTSDNKGAVAAMAIALKALAGLGDALPGRVVLLANADEEAGGRAGIDAVVDRLPRVDAAVVGEASGTASAFEALWVAGRGATRFSVMATGTAMHSSLVSEPGVANALEGAATVTTRLLAELPVLHRRHPEYGPCGLLIPVKASGGEGWGVVPSHAEVQFDLRVTPGEEFAVLRPEIEALVARVSSETGIELWVEFADSGREWIPPSEVGRGEPVVAAAREAWRAVLGAEPPLRCFPGGTDAQRLEAAGIPSIPGIGPGALSRAHRPDEWVTREELVVAARLYARLALEFLEGR